MRLDYDSKNAIQITLSERNLKVLLHKISLKDASAATINIKDASGKEIVVHAEPDSLHYQNRRPDPMHPQTEAFLQQNQDQDLGM